jgi:hypothetical protein
VGKQFYRLPTIRRYKRWALSVVHPAGLQLLPFKTAKAVLLQEPIISPLFIKSS